MDIQSLLASLSEFSQVFFLFLDGKNLKPCFLPYDVFQTPLLNSAALRDFLISRQDSQDSPVIYRDDAGVYFGCASIPGQGHLLFGPMAVHSIKEPWLSRFKKKYTIPAASSLQICVIQYTQIISLALHLYLLFHGESFSREKLLEENQLGNEYQRDLQDEQTLLDLSADKALQEKSFVHHSYNEERQILKAVENGLGRDAIALCMQTDQSIGRLSSNSSVHTMKAVVVSISLCTRAAIRSGIHPDRAYRISDFYIRKLDECADIHSMTECRNRAVWELAEAVRQHLEGHHTSYVEKCKDFIHKHYWEKITLRTAASFLGISPEYLSRLFVQWEGISFQHYLSEFRLEKAALLLRYSTDDIISISEQVHFSSSSYFCKAFKRQYHMTPKQYRNVYQALE